MARSALFGLILLLSVGSRPAIAGESDCIGLAWPITGSLQRPYAPTGAYAGHWGIDIEADLGSAVRAAAAGQVSFAGVVAGNLTVTIDHGGGLRTSYSYLDERSVSAGTWLGSGAVVGHSGSPHNMPGLHFSVRVEGVYVDPVQWLGCHAYQPSRALRLVG